MPEHEQAHRRNAQLAPAAFLVQDRIQVGRVGGIEDRPVPGMGAQLERLVSLEHKDGLRIAPGGQEGRHLPAAEPVSVLEALEVYRATSGGPARQTAEPLTVHLGEAP